MAQIKKFIKFKGEGVEYTAFISDCNSIIITDESKDASNNTVVIDCNEWNDFKNLIDKHFFEEKI